MLWSINSNTLHTFPTRRSSDLERMELREQRALDTGAGLVVRPKPIAKRLDHVVGGDTEIPVAALEHLEHGLQRSEEHTSELQSLTNLVCRLLLEKKKNIKKYAI